MHISCILFYSFGPVIVKVKKFPPIFSVTHAVIESAYL